jgi:hypothetical protein
VIFSPFAGTSIILYAIVSSPLRKYSNGLFEL